MGSGNLLKKIIKIVKDDSSNKVKGSSGSTKSNGFTWRKRQRRASAIKKFTRYSNALGVPIEDLAATRIQTAFRAYRARKILRRLKGTVRLQAKTQTHFIKKQATTTLKYLHSWSDIQSQIRARRLCMVTEGRLRQKKIANQLKLEAKLHELEVEWSGGTDSVEEVLTKIQLKEEAAIKRERTMAYAFSHQWRAPNSTNNGIGSYKLAKANWGWSWVERWIAVRPWERRIPAPPTTPKSTPKKQTSKAGNNSNSPKPKSSNGAIKPRRLSYPGAEKPAARRENSKAETINIEKRRDNDLVAS